MVARNRRNKKSSIKSTLGYIAFAILFILIAGFLFVTNWKIYQKRTDLAEKVNKLEAQVELAQQRNQELKKDIERKESPDYKEEVARNQLDMKKPGEEVYVVQKEQIATEGFGETKKEKSWWDKIKNLFIK